jgi:predicted phosphodiesterase
MRIALLSDIHGNEIALRAVLADVAASGGADAYWILGDLVALGPRPNQVLEILAALPNTRFIRGNTDRYVAFEDRPPPSLDEVRSNPQLLDSLVEIANTFAWTQGMVTEAGWLQWLRDLPLEMTNTLPDGTRFLGVHASPGRDDGPGIQPDTKAAGIAELVAGCNADLVCAGHTHRPSEHRTNGVHCVNVGAVSLSLAENKSSSYVLLEARQDGYQVQHHRVSYDRSAVIDQLNEIGHPGRSYLIKHLSTKKRTGPRR